MPRLSLMGALGALLGAVIALTGCATTSGGVPGDIRRALEQSDSALGTGSLAFSLFEGGDASSAVAVTALEDSLDELIDASTQLARLTIDTSDEDRMRADALGAVRTGEDAVQDARSSVLGAAGVDARAELERARAEVEALLEQLQ
jgi:hypothetical protein